MPGRPGCPAAPEDEENVSADLPYGTGILSHTVPTNLALKHLHDLTSRACVTLLTFPITIFTKWLHVYMERKAFQNFAKIRIFQS